MRHKFSNFATLDLRRITILYRLSVLALAILIFLCMASEETFAQKKEDTRDIAKAEANAFPPPNILTAIQDNDKEGKPWQAAFDFGTVSLLDNTIATQDFNDLEEHKPVLNGIKHIFVLKNDSNQPITINRDRVDCGCVQTRVWGKNLFVQFPYTVVPGAEVRIITALNQDALTPGPVSVTVDLVDKDRQLLASLTMKGKIDNGITLFPSTLDFGRIPALTSSSQEVTLTFNRNIPSRLPPGAPLRLTSSNPYIQVIPIPLQQTITGVKVEGDTIKFTTGQRWQLPEDLVLKYRVDLLKTAPVGVFGGRLRLTLPGFPIYMLVDNVKVQMKGEVVGHMKVAPANVLTLGTLPQGKGAKGNGSITVTAPLGLSDLRVSSANPNLSARFVPIASPAEVATQGTAKAAATAKESTPGVTGANDVDAGSTTGLEIALSPTAPLCRIFDKVIVTNTKNGERLEINVYATVTE